ncbi:MAG: ABC-type metal ion transport system, periplasmic component/surface adhesin [Chloroflexi bacterium]|nr:ABC-type metal ion transport system, periplasmic component/surface adhesin [Chloroflexota bacterium]
MRITLARAATFATMLSAVLWPIYTSATPAPQPPASPLKVLATTTQIQDFVRNVGGDRILLMRVLEGNTDAHEYQPIAEDARKVADADLIFQNGVGLEPWFDRLAQNARPGVTVVKLGEESLIPLRPGDDEEPLGDPHVWFDPNNAIRMVAKIRDTLKATDPSGAAVYESSAEAYTAQLRQLDQDLAVEWSTVPAERRKLVTNHEAFGYYVDRYQLIFVGSVIPGLSTEAEPSAAETQRLIASIRAQGVRAIFTDGSINPRLAQQIAQQAGVQTYSNLYGDSLGKPGSDGDTYIKMMRFNTQTMISGMSQ